MPTRSAASSGTGPPNGSRKGTGAASGSPNGVGSKDPLLPAANNPQDEDWEDWDDWEQGWAGSAPRRESVAERQAARQRMNHAQRSRMGNETPRDEYLRPMIDITGIRYRLRLDSSEAEQMIRDEFETNQWESREALKFAGVLLVVPLVVGYAASNLLAAPYFQLVTTANPAAFALTDKQKVEGAKEVHRHELRLRMDAAIGRAPPLTEDTLQAELRREAQHLAAKFQEGNMHALLNLLSDGASATTLFTILLRNHEGRGNLFRTLGRFFSGLSDTAKAFIIIAATDILLGYHSEEGWTAAIRLLTNHYGYEVEEAPIYLFVAIVPVTMDALFKYWIFKGLNRKNPASAVTLKSMDRH
ncbi:hypothetical protein WJX72_003688 [[Myrmecia] bisecta]|uniref:Proton extrusion protein PcxA n=1 Tax=[Myrmecia] bisecta TaxID=41462 RepID=A0AAW1Q0N1_9CHLO